LRLKHISAPSLPHGGARVGPRYRTSARRARTKIVERRQHGRFSTVDELDNVEGSGRKLTDDEKRSLEV
jgi:hypothetical protein